MKYIGIFGNNWEYFFEYLGIFGLVKTTTTTTNPKSRLTRKMGPHRGRCYLVRHGCSGVEYFTDGGG